MRWSIALLVFVCGCGSEQTPVGPTTPREAPDSSGARVLMVTTTAGFRHDSIGTAVASMRSLAASTNEFTVVATEDLSVVAQPTLASYDVVMFALTSGELPLSADQQAALVNFIRDGKGFVGIHSATDTLYGWPEYGRLVGAYFKEHPWTQQADVVVEDQSHPSTAGLGGRFSIREEFYTFSENPRGRVQVLLRLDSVSVGATGDYPLAWAHSFGAGRVYYNALGHFCETWADQRFLRQLAGAIRWAAGRDART
jgi:type 1 glutamine amidotransferase